jgi:hypothetical protein
MDDTSERMKWCAQGACRRQPTELWFTSRHSETKRACTICDTCPVQTECLAYAVARPTLLGTWAGTTSRDRSVIRARQSC